MNQVSVSSLFKYCRDPHRWNIALYTQASRLSIALSPQESYELETTREPVGTDL